MKLNCIEKGQALLVLRFSFSYRNDIIEQHKNLIEKNGYVWYGKLGAVISNKIINEIMIAKKTAILLYSKWHAYLCGIEEVSANKPQKGYSAYYDEEYIFAGCYYKLTSIDEIDERILQHLIVRSSGRYMSDTLSKQCSSSSFFVSYEEVLPLKAKNINKEKVKNKDCRKTNVIIVRKEYVKIQGL